MLQVGSLKWWVKLNIWDRCLTPEPHETNQVDNNLLMKIIQRGTERRYAWAGRVWMSKNVVIAVSLRSIGWPWNKTKVRSVGWKQIIHENYYSWSIISKKTFLKRNLQLNVSFSNCPFGCTGFNLSKITTQFHNDICSYTVVNIFGMTLNSFVNWCPSGWWYCELSCNVLLYNYLSLLVLDQWTEFQQHNS